MAKRQNRLMTIMFLRAVHLTLLARPLQPLHRLLLADRTALAFEIPDD